MSKEREMKVIDNSQDEYVEPSEEMNDPNKTKEKVVEVIEQKTNETEDTEKYPNMNTKDSELEEPVTREDFISTDELENMSEDEAIIRLEKLIGNNDSIIEKDYLSSLIEQEDKLVYYEVENIYKDNGKRDYKSKLKLNREPPILVLRDDSDNEATFYLTKNLTEELIDTLQEVRRAYLGFSGPIDLEVPDKLGDKMLYYFKKKPLKFVFPILAIIVMILLYNM